MIQLKDSIAIGVMTGLRGMCGPAAVAHRLSKADDGTSKRRSALATALKLAAAGEMVVDKVPGIPPRTDPGPLAGRAVFAAASAAALSDGPPVHKGIAVMTAMVCAIASASAATGLRRRLTLEAGVPDILVAFAEDGIAVWLAGRVAANH